MLAPLHYEPNYAYPLLAWLHGSGGDERELKLLFRGEFSVCKNVFVATRSGWFSDRSAAYMASGRPVVVQETGFSRHLPCGEGLFAVETVDEAAAALDEVAANYPRHSRAAREIAQEHLAAAKVLKRFLDELGVA